MTADPKTTVGPDPVCPHPIDRPFMRQRWEDVVFAHWPVPDDVVADLLPSPLVPDVKAGSAWVSLVTFQMRSLRFTHLPPIPTTRDFPEVNVRTYVVGPDGPGVWFCSLDVPSFLPVLVARTVYGLPYCVADLARSPGSDDGWTIARRWPNRASGTLTVERLDTPAEDPLAVFLTARWRLYAGSRVTRVARIDHEPWPLRRAHVLDCDTGLVAAAGFTVDRAPLAHWAPGVSVRAAAPRRLARLGRGTDPLEHREKLP
ncbi:MAG TPA: DUF2071 domain-containing protein [Acidimicrobiia bacterium]|nr:DUF2071 domain-containing protein [Acidimicrobiia bacterium]